MLEISLQQNVVRFSGDLNRDTVVAHWPLQLLNQLTGEVIFDLAAVGHVDTAGLAWVLQVLATARAAGIEPNLQAMPLQMQKLATVSDVIHLLPVVQQPASAG